MKFQDLPEFERAALKERAQRETLIELWEQLPLSSTSICSPRAVLAGEMLAHVRSVTDIGCGGMDLERCLPGRTYVPVDCVRRDVRTIVVDLNREVLPVLYTEAAALLGVIEYIHDVPTLLNDLSKKYSWFILSYNQADDQSKTEDSVNTWVNSYKKSELEDIFSSTGFSIVRREPLSGQTLWLLKSKTDGVVTPGQSFDFLQNFRAGYDDRIQLSSYQLQAVGAAIRSRAPGCRLLVFGVGNDTGLWLSLNKEGETHFLESSPDWIARVLGTYPSLSIGLLPVSDLTVGRSLDLTMEDMDRYGPPADLAERTWDVILVDGPPGYAIDDPGRAIAITWAARLAGPQTHVFVDDYERPLERKFADGMLGDRRDAPHCVISASKQTYHRELFWSAGDPVEKKSKSHVVVTVATRDYCRDWRFCIDSQHVYCDRHDYEHHVIDPSGSVLHPKWAKLAAAISLLDQGKNVLLIDADAEITMACPPFAELLVDSPHSDIMIVLGISGRPNSGVMILRGGEESIASEFLRHCIAQKDETVPPEDFVTTEGENGHIIWLLKLPRYRSRSARLDRAWNCSDPVHAPQAFVRHYTNILRDELRMSAAKA